MECPSSTVDNALAYHCCDPIDRQWFVKGYYDGRPLGLVGRQLSYMGCLQILKLPLTSMSLLR